MSKAAFLPALGIALSAAAPPQPRLETAVLAGGCFWTMEAVFEHVKGVQDVVSGFAGARQPSNPLGPAEAVRIRYDPGRISYPQLLRIYFSVAHDPSQLNRQGPDVGPSYRSAVFPQTEAQRQAALRAIGAQKARRPVVTRLETGPFHAAPAFHQDFMRRNPRHPYILAHDVPKLAALKRAFPALYKE